MTDLFSTAIDGVSDIQSSEIGALVFVNDAEYEFVGGGAASTNCL